MPFAAYLEQNSKATLCRGTVRSILSVHNHYQQAGGEDCVFFNEAELLEQKGHTVLRYEDGNDRIRKGTVRVARDAVWSPATFERLKSLARSTAIDVAHFHNTFPLISPSAYYAVSARVFPSCRRSITFV